MSFARHAAGKNCIGMRGPAMKRDPATFEGRSGSRRNGTIPRIRERVPTPLCAAPIRPLVNAVPNRSSRSSMQVLSPQATCG
jgi:hypothetical protein